MLIYNADLQLKDVSASRNKLTDLLNELRGYKFVTTLAIEFKKIESDNATKYSNQKAETVINESDIDNVFESIYTTIISNIQEYLGKRSSWICNSVVSHTIKFSRHNPLAASTYTKLSKELDHPTKSFD